VQNGRVSGVNLPWPVVADELAEALDVAKVSVVNDLEANARGIEALGRTDFTALNRGVPSGHNVALVSAGTGLGEAALIWTGTRYHAVAGEGGHADFAPRTELEVELYRFLADEYDHVSYERVCSGSGLVNIYRFLRNERVATSPAEISAEASADAESVGARALELFASIYGARAANVALAVMATGGVYLGGGIAPRMVSTLTNGTFMRAFTAKGRLSALLHEIPVRVVLNDQTALLGAAEIAAERRSALRRAA
jgi:glucokinase